MAVAADGSSKQTAEHQRLQPGTAAPEAAARDSSTRGCSQGQQHQRLQPGTAAPEAEARDSSNSITCVAGKGDTPLSTPSLIHTTNDIIWSLVVCIQRGRARDVI